MPDFFQDLQKEVQDHLFLVMRVFLEKPRTFNDWRGFIQDPDLDHSLDLEKGLQTSLSLLQQINKLNVPIATEFIDPYLASKIKDFVTWGFIGARTTRSPIHRQLAAFLDMPVGFKNPLDGDIDASLQSIIVAGTKHHAYYPDHQGFMSLQKTNGNPSCHLVLRGSNTAPNHHLAKMLHDPLIIDCAHGNSNKTISGMKTTFYESINMIVENPNIKGVMLESFIKEGKQSFSSNIDPCLSLTDPCLDMETTALMILDFYKLLSQSQGSSSGRTRSSLSSGVSSSDIEMSFV